jgi:predicted DNA-binding transcriptional regulator AlpA
MKKPRVISNDSVCNLSELAAFLGVGRSTIYEHMRLEDGAYQVQYPRLGKTTPAHYLAWASQPASTDKRLSPAKRRDQEMRHLLGRK